MPEIPINLIDVRSNLRKAMDQGLLLALAESIKLLGLQQAIGTYAEGERYTVLFGHRRLEACKLAGLTKIPCTIHEKPASDADGDELQLLENIARENLKPLEEANAIDAVMKAKCLSASEVAKRLGLSSGQVTKALALLKLPDAIRQMVDETKITATEGYGLSRIEDPAKQAELAARVVSGELNRDGLSAIMKKAKRPGKRAEKSTRVLLDLGQGRSVTLAAPAITNLDELVACLEEVLATARKARTSGFTVNTLSKMMKDKATT